MKKKIIAILTTCLILTATLIPITSSAYSSYVIETGEAEDYNRTYVNGSISVGQVLRAAQVTPQYIWMDNTITQRVIYPNMGTNTNQYTNVTGEVTGNDNVARPIEGYQDLFTSGIETISPEYKEYKNVKWGRETVETTKMVNWSQLGRIEVTPTTMDMYDGEPIAGYYNTYIELQDVLCYGENLRNKEDYTGESHSLVTRFSINLDDLFEDWQNMSKYDIIKEAIDVDTTDTSQMGQENFYIATNVATGETIRGKFDVRIEVNRDEGTLVYGINAPEFEGDIWKISGKKPVIIRSKAEDVGAINVNWETRYTCLKDSEYIEQLIVEEVKAELPDIVDLGSWLGNAVSGFMEAEIFQGASIGGIFIMFVAFSMVMWLLKLFAGG